MSLSISYDEKQSMDSKSSGSFGSNSLSPPSLPIPRSNSCALTYAVNRGLMRTASGHAMCAPLSPNVYHQWAESGASAVSAPVIDEEDDGDDQEFAQEEMPMTPGLQLNGQNVRTSHLERAQLARTNSWGGKQARESTKKSMLTIPGPKGLIRNGSFNVNQPGSWAEMCVSPSGHSDMAPEEMTPEQRKSAIDTALATILTIPECRESLRRSIAAKMNWAEWAVSPYGGAASPISPFDFYQAAGMERDAQVRDAFHIQRQHSDSILRPPPGLHEETHQTAPATPPTPPTPLPAGLFGAVEYDLSKPEGIGRSAAVRNNPWAHTSTPPRAQSPSPSPSHSEKSKKKEKSIDAPTVNVSNVSWDRFGDLRPHHQTGANHQGGLIKNTPGMFEVAHQPTQPKKPVSIWDRHLQEQAEKRRLKENPKPVEVIQLYPETDPAAKKLAQQVRQPRGKGRSKYTCHIFVPTEIALDTAFRAPSYIIGNGGANMKAIHERTGTKLRVRGKGSGFKERGQFEADAPLHMCISADTQVMLEKTKNMVLPIFERMIDLFCERAHGQGRIITRADFPLTMTMA